MKNYPSIVLLLAFLTAWNSAAAAAQSSGDDLYQEWVEFRNGEITLAFNQIPLGFALHAIQEKTGFQITMPASGEVKLVNLRLERQPFEPAMRAFIAKMGYKNFALMYDHEGRPHRAVVLGSRAADEGAAPAEKKGPSVEPLSAEEREKLQRDLERWPELKQEERGRIEDRLKNLPLSDEREELVKQYGRQVLSNKN